jgi:hypothetical protein
LFATAKEMSVFIQLLKKKKEKKQLLFITKYVNCRHSKLAYQFLILSVYDEG